MTLAFDLRVQKGDFQLQAEAELPAHSVTALVGPSGSGKSTLLRSLAGLEKNTRGRIRFGDQHWLGNQKTIPTHHRQIGYVFQHAALFEHITVFQNLQYAQKRAVGQQRHSLEEIAQTMHIEHLLERQPATLSGGERQRVALARAIASHPQILFLDEPLSAVDETSRHQLSQELEHLFTTFKIPALYVTHNIAEAARLCSHTLRLKHGKTVEFGPTHEILSPHSLIADEAAPAFAIVAVTSRRDLTQDSLSELETAVGPLIVPTASLGNGFPARLLVYANEVGLSLAPVESSSYLNQLPATVTAVAEHSPSQILVTLSCLAAAQNPGSPRTLYSLVTKRSAHHLGLAPGSSLTALVKAVSFSGR